MIFGEYLGEVVSNGEYEVRAQGTTVASLKTAIEAMTNEEYLDSFIVIGSNHDTTDRIMRPTFITNTASARYYETDVNSSNLPNVTVSMYYYNGAVEVIKKNFSSSTMALEVYSTGDSSLTVSAWTLYTRKQTLAIPGALVDIGAKFDTLYSNSSPGASFVAQTLTFVDKDYDYLLLLTSLGFRPLYLNGNAQLVQQTQMLSNDVSSTAIGKIDLYERTFTPSRSGGVITLQIAEGAYTRYHTYATAGTKSSSNGVVIPVKIYGVKDN